MRSKSELRRLATQQALRPGEPCTHPGCASHISHPCEGCGRWAAGLMDESDFTPEERSQHREGTVSDHFDELAAAVRNGFVHDINCDSSREETCDCHVKVAKLALNGLTSAARAGLEWQEKHTTVVAAHNRACEVVEHLEEEVRAAIDAIVGALCSGYAPKGGQNG